jgi:hypothetical protein
MRPRDAGTAKQRENKSREGTHGPKE